MSKAKEDGDWDEDNIPGVAPQEPNPLDYFGE